MRAAAAAALLLSLRGMAEREDAKMPRSHDLGKMEFQSLIIFNNTGKT